jgi:glutamyl-tRNA synthetase
MEKRVRVRFAPSPTGPLHMGGVRTALYNYLFAKKYNGDFILRIEDTDQTRFVPGAEDYIINSLNWAGISPNEGQSFGGEFGPYKQSERKPMYKQYALQLIESGHAYYAFDTSEELEEMRNRLTAAGVASPQYNAVTRQSMKNSLSLSADEVQKKLENGDAYVIRIKIPRNEEVRLKDMIRGWVVVNSSQMDDKVLFKSDGMPTYHLANIVDDYLMKITHVIRGEEWLPSAPLHVLLYKYFGWENDMPQFAHLPLLLRPDGNGKLSKRDGDRLGFPVFPLNWTDPNSGEKSSGYKERGFFPEAFVNMLALLGWNSGDNKELFSLEELIEVFSLERVSKSGAKFDFEKAKWFNQQFLREKSGQELAVFFKPELIQNNIEISDEYLAKACDLIKEKAQFINEFWSIGSYFFEKPKEFDLKTLQKKWNDNTETFFVHFAKALNEITDFNASEIETTFKSTAESLTVSPGSVMQPFRIFISGVAGGPGLFNVAELLGKNEVVERINIALETKIWQ